MVNFLFLFVFLISLYSQSYSSDSFSTILKNKKGKITVLYRNAVPMAYKDGKMKGIEVEIFMHFIHFIKSRHKLKIDIEWVRSDDFSEFYNSVKNSNGSVFGIGSVSIKESRKKELKFSPPYIDNAPVILSSSSFKELSDIKNIATDFKGKKAIVVANTTNEKRMHNIKKDYFPSLEIESTKSYSKVIEKLSSSDGLYFTSLDLVKSWPMITGKNVIHHKIGNGSLDTYGFIMPMNNDWDKLFTEFFDHDRGYRSSSSYLSVIKKYYGQKFVDILKC
jgi:ABC-type amino acid transport substrate-binding protein